MNRKDTFTLAGWNLRGGSKTVKKLMVGISVVFFLAISITVIVYSYICFIGQFNRKHLQDCYSYIDFREEDKLGKMNAEQLSEFVREEAKRCGCEDYCVLNMVQPVLPRENTEQAPYWEVGKTKIRTDGREYEFKAKYDPYQSPIRNLGSTKAILWMLSYIKEGGIFPDFLRENSTAMLGTEPVNPGEIMLDTYFLSVFGMDEEAAALIGQTVTIEWDGNVILDGYRISGIVPFSYLEQREGEYTSDLHTEHLFVNLRKEDASRFYCVYGSIRFYYKDYAEYAADCNMDGKMLFAKVMNDDMVSRTGAKLTYIGRMYCIIGQIGEKLGKLLLIAVGVVTLTIFSSILYLWYFYRKRNERYLNMLGNVGMRKRDRRRLVATELGVICLRALLLAVYGSVIFLLIFAGVLRNVMDFKVMLPWGWILAALGVSGLMLAAVVFFSEAVRKRG